MDFFKSVFSDDPEQEPSDPEDAPISPSKFQSEDREVHHDPPNPDPKPSIAAISNAWSFGGIIKTLASKSETVIENYRRDLEEFGSGLKKETAVIREAATRAVRDLPTSLEAGAAVAQESLESVGEAIDNIGNTVSEIISHGKDSILDGDSDNEISDSRQISDNQSSRPYSRIDAQIRSIQCDLNTYCKEPEDLEEYNEWKLGFKYDEIDGEIERLTEENGVIEEIYNVVVPNTVDEETFWSRYFYRAYKVKKAEEARAQLVKRAISGEEEEVLSWDVDEDDYEESGGSKWKGDSTVLVQEKDTSESESVSVIDTSKVENEENRFGSENDKELVSETKSDKVESEEKRFGSENDKELVCETKSDSGTGEKVDLDGSEDSDSSGNNSEAKSDEKLVLGSEVKTENGGSCKDSDFSVVSSQPSPEEEDLGWDEIEDIGGNEEIKVTAGGSPNRADLRKRLSAMEEEEDLGWDIEDDDEPARS